MEKKITKREMFALIKEAEGVKDNEDMVAFIDHEIELLSRKNNGEKKPTKVQLENQEFTAQMMEFLEATDEGVSIKEIQSSIDGFDKLSNQKISKLLAEQIKLGKVEKTNRKGINYYQFIA